MRLFQSNSLTTCFTCVRKKDKTKQTNTILPNECRKEQLHFYPKPRNSRQASKWQFSSYGILKLNVHHRYTVVSESLHLSSRRDDIPQVFSCFYYFLSWPPLINPLSLKSCKSLRINHKLPWKIFFYCSLVLLLITHFFSFFYSKLKSR